MEHISTVAIGPTFSNRRKLLQREGFGALFDGWRRATDDRVDDKTAGSPKGTGRQRY